MIYIPEYAAVEAAGDTDKLYPYDFACMSYEEDDGYFAELSDTYAADIHTWPMLRCTTPLGAPYTWEQAAANQYMGVMWPQGQHIAVSETSYQELKKAVGEQDRRQAWSAGERDPCRIPAGHFGQEPSAGMVYR